MMHSESLQVVCCKSSAVKLSPLQPQTYSWRVLHVYVAFGWKMRLQRHVSIMVSNCKYLICPSLDVNSKCA